MTLGKVLAAGVAALVLGLGAACGDDSGGDGSTPDEALAVDATALSDNGYEYEIVDVSENATEQVLIENQFNDPPADGEQFLIVRLRVTATPEADGPFGGTTRIRILGPTGQTYTTFGDRCGVVPDRLADDAEDPGTTAEGNLCWSVPSEEIDDLLLFEDATRGNRNYQDLG